MLRATALVLMGVALGGFAAGCGDDSTSNATTPKASPPPVTTTPVATTAPVAKGELDGRTFESTKVIGFDLAKGSKIALTFQDGRLAASAGCNTMSGAYTFKDGELKQGKAATTMMACPDGLEAQDQWLGDFLAGGVTAKLAGDTLTLSNGDATVTLTEAAPAGLPPVVGPTWELVSYGSGDGAETKVAKSDYPPSITLNTDNTVDWYTGCQQGGGEATFADGFVVFAPQRSMQTPCPAGKGATQAAFLKVVAEGKSAAGFDGDNHLTLVRDGTRLVFTQGG